MASKFPALRPASMVLEARPPTPLDTLIQGLTVRGSLAVASSSRRLQPARLQDGHDALLHQSRGGNPAESGWRASRQSASGFGGGGGVESVPTPKQLDQARREDVRRAQAIRAEEPDLSSPEIRPERHLVEHLDAVDVGRPGEEVQTTGGTDELDWPVAQTRGLGVGAHQGEPIVGWNKMLLRAEKSVSLTAWRAIG